MESVCLVNTTASKYMHDAIYESYIQSKIDSEDKLAFAMKEEMVISEADYSNIKYIHEAKFSDKIKVKWKKFIAFIRGLVSKFMESMTNILLDEKEYLEKYKDIILKKEPKSDLEYSYTGKYSEGINRLINTEVPLFNYEKYKQAFEAEEDRDLVEEIMKGSKFSYDDSATLDEQFKSFYLAYDAGQSQGKFSDLKMVDLYNFCYNFSKIKEIVDKDLNRLDSSTRAIESAINKELNSLGDSSTSQTTTTTTTSTTASTGDSSTEKEESAILTEAEDENKSKGVQITQDKDSTSAVSKMQSTTDRDTDAEKDAADASTTAAKGKETSEITAAADRWIRVCRPMIAAKLTACQQIAKDYMAIIRAHVRSYGGTDKKSKEGNKSPDKGSTFKKPENSIVATAKRKEKEANRDAEVTEKQVNATSGTK